MHQIEENHARCINARERNIRRYSFDVMMIDKSTKFKL